MADKSPSCTDKTRSASCDIAHSLQPIEQVEHDRSKATKCHLYWKHRQLHQNLKHSRILIDPKQTRNAKKNGRNVVKGKAKASVRSMMMTQKSCGA